METIKVLIVDDEPLARELLESYLLKMPGYSIVGTCSNALEAFSTLSRQQVDLMLLDINMPEISGIEFLKTIKNPPLVIFTTAYSQFAVESYELDAVDYLLKPVVFDRFIKAIGKATSLLKATQEPDIKAIQRASGSDDILFVKSDGKMVRVDLAELWFVEGLRNYVRLWTPQGKIIVHSTMKNFEDHLATLPGFLRISKSYIVNIRHISEIDGNTVRIKGESITVGSTYRDELNKLLDTHKLS